MKVYDCFLFFNEIDLLEIRLTMLDPHVDFFVLSECDYTFSGNKKPFYFEENKHLFTKFLHKIIHVKNFNSNQFDQIENPFEGKKKIILDKILNDYSQIKNSAETGYGLPHYCRDYLHREYVSLGLSECSDEDIIMLSDIDEIPNPKSIENIKNFSLDEQNYCLLQDCHNYFVNNLSSTNWMGTTITKYYKSKGDSFCNLRRNRGKGILVENGGWHLSFIGGVERIKEKINSYGHQEFNNIEIISDIENKIQNNSDLFNRRIKDTEREKFYYDELKTINLEGYYPDQMIYLLKNKFPYLIKNR